jgi:hypothetical protein
LAVGIGPGHIGAAVERKDLTSPRRGGRLTRLACVGGRSFLAETADKQGTPVQDRDGPAAVTEGFDKGKLIRAIVAGRSKRMPCRDEKASFPDLGSQKTYQRVVGGFSARDGGHAVESARKDAANRLLVIVTRLWRGPLR